MKILSKLKRDFLAALPVIRPHEHIEAELLLAGKKSVAFLDIFDAPFARSKFIHICPKTVHDTQKLDQAVKEGLLISLDMPMGAETQEIFVVRYYAQPEKISEMQRVHDLNKEMFLGDPSDQIANFQEEGELLGYRQRDIMFFSFFKTIPKTSSLNHRLQQLSEYTRPFYQGKLLETLGLFEEFQHGHWQERHDQYIKEERKLRQDNHPTVI